LHCRALAPGLRVVTDDLKRYRDPGVEEVALPMRRRPQTEAERVARLERMA
jgi:hypothetical protein